MTKCGSEQNSVMNIYLQRSGKLQLHTNS